MMIAFIPLFDHVPILILSHCRLRVVSLLILIYVNKLTTIHLMTSWRYILSESRRKMLIGLDKIGSNVVCKFNRPSFGVGLVQAMQRRRSESPIDRLQFR